MPIKTVFHRPRGGGKTQALAEMARRDNGLIITVNAAMAEHIRARFGLREDQVISYHQLQGRGTRGMRPRPIYIDDAELILRDVLRLDRVDGVSMSSDLDYEAPPLNQI
jgi:hypothetical protein